MNMDIHQGHISMEIDMGTDMVIVWTKKTVIVDVILVNNAVWVGKGWKGQKPRVGQLMPDREPGWMGIRHHEQEAGTPSKWGFLIIFCKGCYKIACTLFEY
jgi:hypothetical protein